MSNDNDPREAVVETTEDDKAAQMAVFTMRMGAPELAAIKELANLRGLAASEVIRAAVKAFMSPPRREWTWVSFGALPPTETFLDSSMLIWSGGRCLAAPVISQWEPTIPTPIAA
jgi:hypothetical protein